VNIVHVRGSWGELTVHATTGIIIEAKHDELTEDDLARGYRGYRDIAFFDPVPFAHEGGDEFDILSAGYWHTDGTYVEPLTVRTFEDRYRGVTFMEFDDWVPLALLEFHV
jgi:hypothetical protein